MPICDRFDRKVEEKWQKYWEEKATYGASVKIYAKLLRFGVCMTEEEYEKVRSS